MAALPNPIETDATKPRPIYVIKKKGGHGGHHGGAWKVAYADFVTAMMSLFIVLWLLNSTPQVKQAVAGYFNDPKGSGKETGLKSLGSGETVSIDQSNVKRLKEEIEKAIVKQKDLDKLAKQVEVTVTADGLKIELIEDKGGTFFDSGSARLNESGVSLLQVIAEQLKPLPNRLSIEGHTDAKPFAGDNGYSNWELSSDRANAARRVLLQSGLGDDRISQIRGYASQMLRVAANPLDPANRRISLIVQWLEDAPPPSDDRHAKGQPAKNEVAKVEPETIDTAKPEPGKGQAGESSATPARGETGKPVAVAAQTAVPAEGKAPLLDRVKAMLPFGKKK